MARCCTFCSCLSCLTMIIVVVLALMFTAVPSTFGAAGSVDYNSTARRIIVVDQSGKGEYSKIQDAIDAVPSGNSELVFIKIRPGVYEEKIVVPADKPYVTLSGTQANNTIISWDDSGDIFDCPTFAVLASDFAARYLTIQNTHGAGAKAVALRVSGDRVAFFGCRILSYQDTLLDDIGRHYYSNCFIEGAVDFIFGNAASLFEKCHLHSITDGFGAITAHRRMSPSENTGFIFLGCKISGAKTVLGRPWGPYSRVIFALTYMSKAVLPHGWDNWRDVSNERTVYYGEYKCYGPGGDAKKRVSWSRQLSSLEADPFLNKNMIGGISWIQSLAPSQSHDTTLIQLQIIN